ncbi:MAG: DNA polymerase III subunit gamma/tau [Chlamydiia bacterium]
MDPQTSGTYTVIARRYRPQRFDQVLGQDAIVATLRNAIAHERVAQAYLFCGTRGTGKTTLARLLARALNCHHRQQNAEPCGQCSSCREIAAGISLDVLEIDGASNRGIDDIRALTETAPYAAAGGGIKITIIDEVHMLTKEAFNALLKTLEEPPPNLKFIFATTEPHKVPATILSRCQRFDLRRIPTELLMQKLQVIVRELDRDVSPETLYLIATQAEGSFRDSESLLDQVLAYQSEGRIEAASAAQALGQAPRELWFRLDSAINAQDVPAALLLAKELLYTGIDLTQALEQLLDHLRCHLLVHFDQVPDAMPGEWLAQYRAHRELFQREQLLLLLDEVTQVWQEARQQTPSPWVLEILFMRAARSRQRMPLEQAIQKLLLLEQRLLEGLPQSGGERLAPPAQVLKAVEQVLPPKQAAPVPAPQKPIPVQPPVAAPAPVVSAPKVASPPPVVAQAAPAGEALPPGKIDTLLRFAAVELEGTLSPPPKK